MRLPAELRNKIYNEVIRNGIYEFELYTEDFYGSNRYSYKTGLNMCGPRAAWVGLLSTSRQIYMESRLLPYALNTFHLLSLWELDLFLKLFHWQPRYDVTSIRLKMEDGINNPLRGEKNDPGLTKSFPNLKTVEIIVEPVTAEYKAWSLRFRRLPKTFEGRLENMRKWLVDGSGGRIEVIFV
jgi:hypothetical protein